MLIVEDNSKAIQLFSQCLKELEVQCVIAESGKEGISLLNSALEKGNLFDTIFLKVGLVLKEEELVSLDLC